MVIFGRGRRLRLGGITLVSIFFILILLTVSLVSAAAYTRNLNVPYSSSFNPEGLGGFGLGGINSFDRSLCQAGQDFLLQVSPLGCTPSVVRSDLLEEQNVPVFCPIVATQLNPLIDVETIDRIQFLPGESNQDVAGITHYPARAALGGFGTRIDSPVLGNIGYAVVVLKQQPNGTAMPDFVEGNITAKINYDIQNAFGVGRASFYLPELSIDDWENDFRQYGFWQGRGYLKAENIGDNRATISIYSDRETYGFGSSGEKRVVSTVNLEVGEKSNELFIPGFEYCLGGLKLKLTGLEDPSTRVKIDVNGDYLELADGEKFLENKCQIRNIEKQGIVQKTRISCNEDEGRTTFDLIVSPKINLKIGSSMREVSLGDFLYRDGDYAEKSVYLAYIGTKGDSVSEQNLFVMTVSLPRNDEKLSEGDLASFSRLVSRFSYSEITGNQFADIFANVGKFYAGAGEVIFRNIIAGDTFRSLSFGETKSIFGNDLSIEGFAGAVDAEIVSSGDGLKFQEYYDEAEGDYETVHESFSEERYPPSRIKTLGVEALEGEIELAWRSDQKRFATQLCEEFEDAYPDEASPIICGEAYKLSSSEPAAKDLVIDGRTKRISFDRIREPTFEEFGATISVKDPFGNVINIFEMRRNHIIYLNQSENEFIQLLDVDSDSATIRGNLNARNKLEAVDRFLTESSRKDLKLGDTETFGSNYAITLQDTNIKKVAKVSVLPEINYRSTEAELDFKIGIEKRGIPLSPEKIQDQIEFVNSTIETLSGLNENLGKIVSAGKAACYGTGALLSFKNFISNLGGEGIARQKIMRGNGGWFEFCETKVNNDEYGGSIDSCLLDNSESIEAGVNAISDAMKTQDDRLDNLQELCKISNGFLGEDIVDPDCLTKNFVNQGFRNELESNLDGKIGTIKIGNENVPVSEITNAINSNTTFLTQARDIQLNARLLSSDDERVVEVAKSRIEADLGDIWVNVEGDVERQNLFGKYGIPSVIGSREDLTEFTITEAGTFGDLGNRFSVSEEIEDSSFVYIYKDRSTAKEYLLVLDNDYVVRQTYLISGNVLTLENNLNNEPHPNPLGLAFNKFDRTTYENKYLNPKLRYYETDPYRGLPAIVPFDVDKGWYASIKSTISIGGSIRSLDDSGRISSFYLCNVGEGGREEFNSGIGNDICQMINLGTGQPINQFPGLEEGEASRLVTRAVSAIAFASERYHAGISELNIGGHRIDVGEPAINIPDMQCQDFMSSKDCNFLFNVCDPVICPSSRCDFGGAYPVRDVIQSGIGGSLLLCAPNFPEVKVPICLAGLHAGIDGFLSVADSYQQCLQTSLETGQTVGICDEIYSVHMCEFIWRQGLPVTKILANKALGKVLGQDVGGGGEYLSVNDAFQKAEDSADFFTQSYAVNSFRAFKARSAEGVGTEFCKNFVSLAGPQGGNLFDSLIAPDSPPQFHGRFDEIPFTTITNPPTSQYKVFYHVYAGNDFPASYQVYLRDPAGSSFFQDTSFRRIVASGFINAGEKATATEDFTAPSGFSQMCIIVNGQEECGFKQVTTEMGLNYLTDRYVASEAIKTDITSETACISGTPNFASLINPSLQGGAEEFINPAIYNRGITRICSTDNPGIGTDPFVGTEDSRWKQVGICGNANLKCWLDAESVKGAIRTTTIEDEILSETSDNFLEILKNEEGFVEDFGELVKEIESEEGLARIGIIEENENKVFYNFEKAYLRFVRANTYKDLALQIYEKIRGPSQETGEGGEGDGERSIETIMEEFSEEMSNIGNYPVFEFDPGVSAGSLYYTYSGKNWFWTEEDHVSSGDGFFSKGDVEWTIVDINSVPSQGDLLEGEVPVPADVLSSNSLVNRLSQRNQQFLEGMIDKSYSEGLWLLIQRTIENQEGRFLFFVKRNAVLSTGSVGLGVNSVDFSSDGIFKVHPTLGEEYRFDYPSTERKWRWNFYIYEDSWQFVPEIETVGEGQLHPTIVNLIKSLDGKIFRDGSELIFGTSSTGSSVGTISMIEEAGVGIKEGATLERVRQQTLLEIINLKNECDCEIVITSGTDGQHEPGQYSHANGYKVDLRTVVSLNDYLQENFEIVDERTGGVLVYKNPESGALYALEGDHWDVLVIS